jgi:hypothetical protein
LPTLAAGAAGGFGGSGVGALFSFGFSLITGAIGGAISSTCSTLSTGAAFFDDAFLAGAFLAGAFLGVAATAGNFSRNFRTTGASTVEDAERTNSPISWSFARTSLLSIPTSFANS